MSDTSYAGNDPSAKLEERIERLEKLVAGLLVEKFAPAAEAFTAERELELAYYLLEVDHD